MSEDIDIAIMRDILDIHKEEFSDIFSGNIMAMLLYGSYASQDLGKEPSSFGTIDDVLDKKPDFLMVAEHIDVALLDIGGMLGWDEETREYQTELAGLSPNFYNLETTQEYSFMFMGKEHSRRLPYKIGVIGAADFMEANRSCREHKDLCTAIRISKPSQKIYVDDGFREPLEDAEESARQFFAELALADRKLPKAFTGEQFLENYLGITYKLEMFRRSGIRKMLNYKIYNIEDHSFRTMKDAASDYVFDLLRQLKGVHIIDPNDDILKIVYEKDDDLRAVSFREYRRKSLKTTIKNIRTARAAGYTIWDMIRHGYRKTLGQLARTRSEDLSK